MNYNRLPLYTFTLPYKLPRIVYLVENLSQLFSTIFNRIGNFRETLINFIEVRLDVHV